ncbi:hypothetical protein CWN64_06080, partial [Klebsiella pneumoniae]
YWFTALIPATTRQWNFLAGYGISASSKLISIFLKNTQATTSGAVMAGICARNWFPDTTRQLHRMSLILVTTSFHHPYAAIPVIQTLQGMAYTPSLDIKPAREEDN